MVMCSQVKRLNDFTFLIVPDACPRGVQSSCDSCSFSNVKFGTAGQPRRRSRILVGFVSCSYPKAA